MNGPLWRGSARSLPMAILGVTTVLAAMVVLLVGGQPAGWVTLGVVGVALVVAAEVRVDVSSDALKVRWGQLGVPVNRVRLTDIVDAQAVVIRPRQAGGWGYRGSRVLFGHAAVVVRRGPAIRLELARNRVFVVTVDDAPTGTTVLQELIEQRNVDEG